MNIIKKALRMNWKEAWPLIKQGHKQSKRSYLDLIIDLYNCYKEGYNWGEYFIFGFQFNQNKEYRDTFVRGKVHFQMITDMFKVSDEGYNFFDDKGLFNHNFSDLKGIDTLDLRVNDFNDFKNFTKKHYEFFVKSATGDGGHEVKHICLKDIKVKLEVFFNQLIKDGLVIVEEKIIQHSEVAKLSVNAVNSIRIVTVKDINGNIKAPFIASRIATGYAHVDNCSLGGASCILDSEGVVNYDYFANIPIIKYYDRNIITGFKFKGFKFPYFKESISLCIEAAKRCESHFIGWDVAITENGPVLIEANRAPSFDLFQAKGQLENNRGKLKELEEALGFKLSKNNFDTKEKK